MPTWVATTIAPTEANAQTLGDALATLDPAPDAVDAGTGEDVAGARARPEGWTIIAYFSAPPDPGALALLARAHGVPDFDVSQLPDADWVAVSREALAPVEAGRFFVHGSHDAGRVPAGRIGILVEASMAFGTGHHATTLGCLRALDLLAGRGMQPAHIADIGCGTAVLAMAAAHLWPAAEIIAADIDPLAVEVARDNVARNGLAERVTCAEAAGFAHPALAGPFDLVCANILKGPLIELAPAMIRANRPAGGAGGADGAAILSGILDSQADEVAQRCLDVGYSRCERFDIGDWTTLIVHTSP